MIDLNAMIERVLELDDKATKGPWRCTSDLPLYAVAAEEYDIANSESRRYRAYDKKHLGMREKDARLIAEYRTLAPILARELKRYQKVVEAAIKDIESYDCAYPHVFNRTKQALKELEGE